MPDLQLAYCETSSATVSSPHHVRIVGAEGLKLGGGAPGAALCGRDLRLGWDIRETTPDELATDRVEPDRNWPRPHLWSVPRRSARTHAPSGRPPQEEPKVTTIAFTVPIDNDGEPWEVTLATIKPDPPTARLVYWCWNVGEPVIAVYDGSDEPKCPDCGYVDPCHLFLFKVGKPRKSHA